MRQEMRDNDDGTRAKEAPFRGSHQPQNAARATLGRFARGTMKVQKQPIAAVQTFDPLVRHP
jgi:hypothetical protein